MTRAKDRLVLTGVAPTNAVEKWQASPSTAHKLLSARSYIDWIGPWLAARAGDAGWLDRPRGNCKLFDWFTHQAAPSRAELPLKSEPANPPRQQPASQEVPDTWQYPYLAATREIATQRVTSLRERLAEDDVAAAVIPRIVKTKNGLSPLQVGNAHHQFLQLMTLDGPWTESHLKQQAEDMRKAGYLTDFENLDYSAILSFWNSDLGQRVLANREFLHREIPFTARMSPEDVKASGLDTDEFIIVRGAVDLAVILPSEIWVLDFKTDAVSNGDLTEALRIYTPQVRLYGQALERIYRRPALLYLHFLALDRTVRIEAHQT
jgi:ATP-dependent helicase/nuclease subunit A